VFDTASEGNVVTNSSFLDPGTTVPCFVVLDGIEGHDPINVDMKGQMTLRLGDHVVTMHDVYVAPQAHVLDLKDNNDVYEPTLLMSVRLFTRQFRLGVLFCDDGDTVQIINTHKTASRVIAQSTAIAGNMYIVPFPDTNAPLPSIPSHTKILKTSARSASLPRVPGAHDGLNTHMHTRARKDTKAELLGKLVHRRLHVGKSHPVISALKVAYGDSLVPYEGPCDPCAIARLRMHARSKHSRRKATYRGERIHYDLFTFTTRTPDFIKYVVVFVDEYTSKVWVRGCRKKSELFPKLIALIKMLEKETRTKIVSLADGDGEEIEISCLRSDNGRENLSKASQLFCAKEGIKIETSVPYMQWQNGSAERNGGVLMKHAAALRFAGFLPERDWYFCIQAACHIHNLLPNTGKKVDYI